MAARPFAETNTPKRWSLLADFGFLSLFPPVNWSPSGWPAFLVEVRKPLFVLLVLTSPAPLCLSTLRQCTSHNNGPLAALHAFGHPQIS